MTTASAAFDVESISADFGVRLHVSAERILDVGVPEQCLALLNRYGVLVFPAIGVSDEAQVAFSNRMGTMQASQLRSVGDNPADRLGIYPVTLDPSRAKYIDYILSNENWHMDGTTYRVPPKATCLKCEMPASSGGDTEFANLFAAYDALPAAQKQRLEGLRVVHSVETTNRKTHKNPSAEDVERWRRQGPPHEHPLVWKHGDGRTSLVIGATADHIVGMDWSEGKMLLDELLAWSTRPEFCYRHRWSRGDMVIWNNCGLLHRAHHYTADSGRLMHRTTIMGTEAIA
jgi:alpha-ketoglutarate-dependent taurine dioxygenase